MEDTPDIVSRDHHFFNLLIVCEGVDFYVYGGICACMYESQKWGQSINAFGVGFPGACIYLGAFIYLGYEVLFLQCVWSLSNLWHIFPFLKLTLFI